MWVSIPVLVRGSICVILVFYGRIMAWVVIRVRRCSGFVVFFLLGLERGVGGRDLRLCGGNLLLVIGLVIVLILTLFKFRFEFCDRNLLILRVCVLRLDVGLGKRLLLALCRSKSWRFRRLLVEDRLPVQIFIVIVVVLI